MNWVIAAVTMAAIGPVAPAWAVGSVALGDASSSLGLAGDDHDRAVRCLAEAISYEAGHEPEAGQRAVAQVILNRLRDPAYPKTVCGVVYQGSARRSGCQFTFTCDGAMARRKPGATWPAALAIATRAVDGGLPASAIGGALNYHADYVRPGWAARLTRVAQIGQHIFYRAAGRAEEAIGRVPDAPRAATLSVWGLATAVLVPVRGGVEVRRN